ncbi:MAG: tetratricopeptide repeat protein [Pseudomonadota bacterium]|nr:tetratricopeptide repeat protein [Pseudomonadota bacterium]
MRNWIKLLILATMLPSPGDTDEYGFDAGKDAFVSENYAAAVAIWREKASAGDADAQLAMGLVCRRWVGVPKTAAKTVKWLGLAATQGLAHAAYYCEAAARQRLAVAQLYIAVIYGDSLGVPRNEVQAAAWFRKAADQGHVAT